MGAVAFDPLNFGHQLQAIRQDSALLCKLLREAAVKVEEARAASPTSTLTVQREAVTRLAWLSRFGAGAPFELLIPGRSAVHRLLGHPTFSDIRERLLAVSRRDPLPEHPLLEGLRGDLGRAMATQATAAAMPRGAEPVEPTGQQELRVLNALRGASRDVFVRPGGVKNLSSVVGRLRSKGWQIDSGHATAGRGEPTTGKGYRLVGTPQGHVVK